MQEQRHDARIGGRGRPSGRCPFQLEKGIETETPEKIEEAESARTRLLFLALKHRDVEKRGHVTQGCINAGTRHR